MFLKNIFSFEDIDICIADIFSYWDVCTTSEVAKSIISICPCSVKMHWGGGGDDVLALGSNLSSFSSNLLHLLLELNVYVISFVFKSF